ncbi:MAG: Crp/Fnr family transcriptional regulator [Acidobacteria bacterium]|nr:Crp/Fnr family transcriptional regulator [Acidobacteriota bacterium]
MVITNQLLAALPARERKRLLPILEPVPLTVGDVLYNPDDAIRHVYFPNRGVVSIINTLGSHLSIEVGMVGREGMVGIPVFLGVSAAINQAVVQVPGDAVRMSARAFKEEAKRDGPFHDLLHLYTHALLTQMSLSIACNRFHNVEKRFARWLLVIHDRVDSDEFVLTQEYIARMLGAHRPHVTTAARTLQGAGLISYNRGKLAILNRRGLEKASCACYRNGKEKFDGHFRT